MSGEAERAAQERADLHELVVARLSEAMDSHGMAGTRYVGDAERSLCECGYLDPYGVGLGMHQLEQAAWAVLDLIPQDGDR